MPLTIDTLESVQLYLIDLGLVRDPDTIGSEPPAWLDPRDGVPEPTDDDPLVVGIFRSTGVPSRPFQGFIRVDGVEFIVRSKDAKAAVQFEAAVRDAINDKRNWDMHSLRVNQSNLMRDLQPLGSGPQGYLFNFEYMIERWN